MSSRPRLLRPFPLLLAGLLLLGLLAAGHSLVWRGMAARLQNNVELWAQARRAAGWRVEYATPQRGGWPFAATLRLPEFRLQGPALGLPGGLEWQSTALVMQVSLPWLDDLRIEPRGPQRLRLGTLELPFAADRLVGRLPLQSGVPPRGGELLAERLRLGLRSGTAGLELRRLRATLDSRSTATEGENAVSLNLGLEGITLPPPGPGQVWPLGPRIDEAGFEADLTGPLPVARQPLPLRAAAWRDAGGALALRDVSLRWGAFSASAAATMALDEQLQPMGAGTLRVSGASEALASMTEAGMIEPRLALVLRSVLHLLFRPSTGAEPVQAELPLALENRRLTVARLPLLRVPALDWPGGAAAGGKQGAAR